jgi:hypothetical protein
MTQNSIDGAPGPRVAGCGEVLGQRPTIDKAKRPKSLHEISDWLIYRVLKTLGRSDWLFSERRLYKFRKAANKRAAALNKAVSLHVAMGVSAPTQQQPTQTDNVTTEMLANLRPIEATVADYLFRPPKLRPCSKKDFKTKLSASLNRSNGSALLAFSHDEYRNNIGGVQLCMLVEETAIVKRGMSHIHLAPAKPLPVLANNDSKDKFHYSVTIDGDWLGHVTAADVLGCLADEKSNGKNFYLAIHSLLGHSPETTADLYRASGATKSFFWLHDFFSLCLNYTLMRNSIKSCGAPPEGSAGCSICYIGDHRSAHLNRLRTLFSAVPFTVVAPSEATMKLWQGATRLSPAAKIVHEHCEIRKGDSPAPAPASDSAASDDNKKRPISVAYLGLPMFHKGWTVFAGVVRDMEEHPDFTFHHLGKYAGKTASKIAFTPVSVSIDNWHAMSEAVRTERIDVAFLCSLCAETYNFTFVEALVGGAFIVTLESSGNIAAQVRRFKCGAVYEDEAALKLAFSDGSLADKIRHSASETRPTYQASFRNMTADLI